MIIKKKELLESLKMCMPGIETGSAVLQGADSFVFHKGKIYSYNDVISVCVPITQEGLLEEKIEGCVKAEEFFKIITKFPSDEIKFTVTEKGSWLLECGKAKAEMTLMNFDFAPRFQNIAPDKDGWIKLDEDFMFGVGTCKMSVNKTQLSGVYFEGQDIISTDGNQMNCYTMKETELPKFWISDNSANELLKLKKLVSMQLQGTWAHFKAEDETMFSIKTLQADTYPASKLKNIIDTSNPEKATLHAKFPKDLFNAIDRAVSFSMDIFDHSAVRLVISKEKIEVSAERSAGKYSEKVDWDEEIKEDFEPLVVYVDAVMMQFVAQRTVEFYLLKGPMRNGKSLPRLLFVTDASKHLLCTLDAGAEDEE